MAAATLTFHQVNRWMQAGVRVDPDTINHDFEHRVVLCACVPRLAQAIHGHVHVESNTEAGVQCRTGIAVQLSAHMCVAEVKLLIALEARRRRNAVTQVVAAGTRA
jgi:hypothetical protein